jgi:hypothetical protein
LERENRRQERDQHPEIRGDENQVMEYQALAASIKSFEERKDSQGRTLSTGLIGASQTVQRYNDDQKKDRADYIPVSVQPQFNKRALYLSLLFLHTSQPYTVSLRKVGTVHPSVPQQVFFGPVPSADRSKCKD